MFKTIDPEISDNNEPTTGGRQPNKAGKVPNVNKLKGDPEDEDEIDEDYFKPNDPDSKDKKPGDKPYVNARPLPFYRKETTFIKMGSTIFNDYEEQSFDSDQGGKFTI